MNKRIANSPGFRLLPLAAALVVALAFEPEANARSGGNDGALRHEYSEQGGDVRWLFSELRQRRHSPLVQEQPLRRCRTTVVRNCHDGGSGSLRDAVASAVSGDTIDLGHLRCRDITLSGGAIAVAVDDLTIEGSRHHTVRIDGNHADRVFYHSGAGTLSLSDVTLTHGYATAPSGFVFGGCVFSAGSVTLDHASVIGCDVSSSVDSSYGGGVFASDTATLISSMVSDNTVHAARHAIGAGVLAYSDVVQRSTISNNSAIAVGIDALEAGASVDASMGAIGAIYNLDISDSVIDGNTLLASTAFADQVAVANEGGAHSFYRFTLARSTVSNNAAQAINTGSSPTVYAYAYSIGGGARGYSLVVTDSTISGNSTSAIASNPEGLGFEGSSGGGLRTFGLGPGITVINSTVSGNSSTRSASAYYAYGYAKGGGIYGNGYALSLQNSTIASNAAEFGGGVYEYRPATLSADSSIVARNTQGAGGTDFDAHEVMTVAGANNLVGSAGANVILPVDTLFADPMLAPLADNGGPTLTHALQSGSPAINAGNNVGGLQFDQRGQGFPREIGPVTDIGAFEKRGGH